MTDAKPLTDLDAYLDHMSQVLNLPIPPEYRPGVLDNLNRTMAIAQLVLEFPLPPEVEPAPTFHPGS